MCQTPLLPPCGFAAPIGNSRGYPLIDTSTVLCKNACREPISTAHGGKLGNISPLSAKDLRHSKVAQIHSLRSRTMLLKRISLVPTFPS
jgi:hypothetical protein